MLTESNALKVMWLYAMQHTAIKTQTAGQHSSNEPAKVPAQNGASQLRRCMLQCFV